MNGFLFVISEHFVVGRLLAVIPREAHSWFAIPFQRFVSFCSNAARPGVYKPCLNLF
jgi:hypothetical protein